MNIKQWCDSIAPVWLAETISAPERGENYGIVHVGANEGHTCFALAQRFPNLRIHGIEWNRDLVRQASEFVRTQNLQGRVEILHSEGGATPPRLAAGTFDQAIMIWTGKEPPSLAEQIRMTLMMLKPQGILTMLMEPKWLTYMMDTWKGNIGNINLFPLWFDGRTTSDYILLQAQKNAQDALTLHKGFTIKDNV